VSAVNTAPPAGHSFQSTAAAVAAAHADVSATGETFAARLQSTADDMTIAAFEFSLAETDSASAVASVTTEV
jgi:hypothetical protein